MKIVALITCRGNNTLKDKHLKKVKNKYLIEYPLLETKKVLDFDDLFISTDDDKIINIAKKYNYKIIKRPDDLAKPDSQHIDAIKHAINFIYKTEGYKPDILVVILGNTVFLKKEWIQKSISEIRKNTDISSIIPVYLEQDHHPFRAKYINEKGYLDIYFKDTQNVSTNRQDLPKNYFLCHNFWTLNVKESIDKEKFGQIPWKFMGNKIKPLILDQHLDVHDEKDLILCEEWIENNKT